MEYLQNKMMRIKYIKRGLTGVDLPLHGAGDILDEDDADRNEAGQDNEEDKGRDVSLLQVNLIKLYKCGDPRGDFL